MTDRGDVYVILKDHHTEGLRPFAAYANQEEAQRAYALLVATGMESYVVWYASSAAPLLVAVDWS